MDTVNLNPAQIQQLREVRADRERAGDGLPRHDHDRPRTAGERERHRPDLERLRRSRDADGAGTGALAVGCDRGPRSGTRGGVGVRVLAGAAGRGPAGGREDAATRPEELHDRGRRGAALPLVQRGRLSPAEPEGGSEPFLHRRFPPAAGRDAAGGGRGARTAAAAVRAGDAEAVPGAVPRAGGGAQRVGGTEHRRNAVPAAGRGGSAAGDRMRERVDSAAGAGRGAAARVRGARRGGGAGRPHDPPAAHGVDAAGRRSARRSGWRHRTESWRASRRCCRGSRSRRRW